MLYWNVAREISTPILSENSSIHIVNIKMQYVNQILKFSE